MGSHLATSDSKWIINIYIIGGTSISIYSHLKQGKDILLQKYMDKRMSFLTFYGLDCQTWNISLSWNLRSEVDWAGPISSSRWPTTGYRALLPWCSFFTLGFRGLVLLTEEVPSVTMANNMLRIENSMLREADLAHICLPVKFRQPQSWQDAWLVCSLFMSFAEPGCFPPSEPNCQVMRDQLLISCWRYFDV